MLFFFMIRYTNMLGMLAFILLLSGRQISAQTPSSPESLSAFAARMGFPPPQISEKSILLKSHYSTLHFEEESRKLLFNKTLIWMNLPLSKKGQDWTLPHADISTTLMPLLKANRFLKSNPVVLVIDPGHGGKDIGATSPGKILEKKMVLDIAKRLEKKLHHSGMKVQLTRDSDTTLTLADRIRKADEWKADLFVSIHLNSAPSRTASGMETFILSIPGFSSTSSTKADLLPYPGNRHDTANMSLAYFLQKGLLACSGGQDRGVKRARFDILKNAPCPAALVECGFLSHAEDEKKIAESVYRETIADGLAQGIVTWVDRTLVVPAVNP